MAHMETMAVRLSIVDLVSATKQLVDFHEIRLQKFSTKKKKSSKCEFREHLRSYGHTLPKGVS